MGQARKRGTREERIEQSIIARQCREEEARQIEAVRRREQEERRRALQAEYDALTPEEKEAYRKEHPERFRKRTNIGTLAALSLFAGAFDYHRY